MRAFVVAVILLVLPGVGGAKGPGPEESLKGKIIISDKSIPSSWTSVPSYVATLKGLNRSTLWYDKKTGKLKISYAAFFAKPVHDVQVMLVLYDITRGAHQQKLSTEQFMPSGSRVLFNSIELDKEDVEGNKKYLVTIEDRHHMIASGTVILRQEGPHYSGRVDFSDADTKPSAAQ